MAGPRRRPGIGSKERRFAAQQSPYAKGEKTGGSLSGKPASR
jgi:hypothetical protein